MESYIVYRLPLFVSIHLTKKFDFFKEAWLYSRVQLLEAQKQGYGVSNKSVKAIINLLTWQTGTPRNVVGIISLLEKESSSQFFKLAGSKDKCLLSNYSQTREFP